ncbi:MAG: hypothetical protein KC417_05870, partial [Myxococcales bacterium]|nr:hypothetical protein [Myxococcales bacterium]
RQPEHGDVLLVVSVALADPTMLAPRAEAALVAATRGQIEVARLLAQDRRGDDQEPGRVPDFGGARPLTLGERKTLARTSDRRLILKALRDPHPDVIRILLKNPRLIEDDVVRLAATRPIDPSILLAVFTDLRWVLRYRVRRTLVYNPHTPLDVALQLALNLNDQDLRAVSDSKSLRAELRDLTKRMLADVEVN